MSVYSFVPSFHGLAESGAPVLTVGINEQCYFVLSLGLRGETAERFDHIVPIPDQLRHEIEKGIKALMANSQLTHKGHAYAILTQKHMTWLAGGKLSSEFPPIEFDVKPPEFWCEVFANHTNVQWTLDGQNKRVAVVWPDPFFRAVRGRAKGASMAVSQPFFRRLAPAKNRKTPLAARLEC